jgi:GNAT superfamily N-acetyltransferase
VIKPTIRPAIDADSAEIQRVLSETGLLVNGLDWSKIYPSWLVAEYKGEIVGTIQVLLGYPLGHMDILAVVPKYQNLGFGVYLWRAAEHILTINGCDGYTVFSDSPCILKHIGKLGGVIFGPPANWIFKRVPQLNRGIDEVLQKTGT